MFYYLLTYEHQGFCFEKALYSLTFAQSLKQQDPWDMAEIDIISEIFLS